GRGARGAERRAGGARAAPETFAPARRAPARAGWRRLTSDAGSGGAEAPSWSPKNVRARVGRAADRASCGKRQQGYTACCGERKGREANRKRRGRDGRPGRRDHVAVYAAGFFLNRLLYDIQTIRMARQKGQR